MNSMVHLSSRIQHQAEYKELLANAEHQIKRIGLIKGNSKTRQDQQIRNMKRFLKLINENFNPNFTQSPHDFFILNVSENHEKFIEFVSKGGGQEIIRTFGKELYGEAIYNDAAYAKKYDR